MAEVDFPSPSRLLEDATVPNPPPSKTNRSKTATAKAKANGAGKRRKSKNELGNNKPDGVKPKQTKSRDGCITCKEKRLKCDENHPTCLQCKKRKVECGGYKKTFTFRTIEKSTFPFSHGSSKPKKRTALNARKHPPPQDHFDFAPVEHVVKNDDLLHNAELPADSQCDEASIALYDLASKLMPDSLSAPYEDYITLALEDDRGYSTTPSPPDRGFSVLSLRDRERQAAPILSPPSLPHSAGLFSPNNSPPQDPLSLALQQQGSDTDDFADCDMRSQAPAPMETDDDVEDIPELELDRVTSLCYPSPCLSHSSCPSGDLLYTPLNHLDMSPEHSGLLHKLFLEQTCGILSIKNGPDENPWRTMLWPVVYTEPALYFAILSMTASHAASRNPELRVKGLELMTTSMELLRNNLASMRSDTALATALVLAFSESWHSHIYTGILHLRGARDLISRGLQSQEQAFMDAEDIARLRFLRSTWVYMDVIARLTTLGGEDPEDLDKIVMPTYGPEASVHEIDPLMGCATTLFPLIGAVANLVKRVRKTQKTPYQVVARAAALRDQLHKWQVPTQLVPPRDESLEMDHSRHTAEAYRWATLLFLYQSVPMVCTEEPLELAELTLGHLAAVPVTSRATIIHIFPLLAAGCEAKTDDDRSFVAERWEAMINRMCIGNLDRCWDVVKEVWERRDTRELERQEPSSPSHPTMSRTKSLDYYDDGGDGPSEFELTGPSNLMKSRRSLSHGERMRAEGARATIRTDPEKTVRGRLHWLAVMTEKKWEILLG